MKKNLKTPTRPSLQSSLPAFILAGSLAAMLSVPAYAVDRIKALNATNLNLAGSFSTTPNRYDRGIWNATAGAIGSTVSLGGDLHWRSLVIDAAAAFPVTINGPGVLTLGDQGINLSAATQNLTINAGVRLMPYSAQDWNVNAGRILTLGGTFERTPQSVLHVKGAGTVTVGSLLANDATGIVAPWLLYGAGTSLGYGTVSGGGYCLLYRRNGCGKCCGHYGYHRHGEL